jgi:hypothetical protein
MVGVAQWNYISIYGPLSLTGWHNMPCPPSLIALSLSLVLSALVENNMALIWLGQYQYGIKPDIAAWHILSPPSPLGPCTMVPAGRPDITTPQGLTTSCNQPFLHSLTTASATGTLQDASPSTLYCLKLHFFGQLDCLVLRKTSHSSNKER